MSRGDQPGHGIGGVPARSASQWGLPCPISSPPTRTTPPRPAWTTCVLTSTPTSTPAATSTWITPVPGWPPMPSCAPTWSGCGGCFGNPPSESPASAASTLLIEQARQAVLRYFNAAAEEYAVIFTPNATGACRLVGEAYPFGSRTRLVLTADNHNAMNGIREFARAGGAAVRYVSVSAADLRIAEAEVAAALGRAERPGRSGRRGLFGYPAQSNFSGVQHPLAWVDLAQAAGYDVLLDAAAFVPTNRLDLAVVKPEFVTVSWYKMFGYPTGIGCLLARRDALARLRRPWFSGGTVWGASVLGGWHRLADDETAFEDGTVNFLGIPDVTAGLAWIADIGIDLIH